MAASVALHIFLLGAFRVLSESMSIVGVNGSRLQSLFAYLVLHRDRPHARRHLAFLLWPDSTDAQAHTNLRYLLHQLRHALPHPDLFLEAADHTLQWRPSAPATVDVQMFEAAIEAARRAEQSDDTDATTAAWDRAVELYRGDLLPGAHDDWILSERERLRHAVIGALERLREALERQGKYSRAIECSRHLLQHDPFHEATYRHLMRLHAVVGNRAEAVRVYHACAAVLRRELDVEPDAATRAAYVQVLSGELA